MTPPRILIAGIGNIFLGDDAFGVAVAHRLLGRELPEGVRVIDFGIRGLDLTYALLDGYEAVILVDTISRGMPTGTLSILEPTDDDPPATDAPDPIEPHNLDPRKVLRLAAGLGGRVDRLLLVGCEPAPLDPDTFQDGLSPPVRAAVDEAVPLIEELAARLLRGDRIEARSHHTISD